MIIGEYHQKIGDKNRIAFPKDYRKAIGDDLIVTKGYEKCLVIMSPVQWEEMVNSEISGPFVSRLIRDTSRFLLASASKIQLDSQGRFVIPKYLIEYAKLQSEGIFLGLGRWVELWSIESWNVKRKDVEDESTELGDKLSKLQMPSS